MVSISRAEDLKRSLNSDITSSDEKRTKRLKIQEKVIDSLYDTLDEMTK